MLFWFNGYIPSFSRPKQVAASFQYYTVRMFRELNLDSFQYYTVRMFRELNLDLFL